MAEPGAFDPLSPANGIAALFFLFWLLPLLLLHSRWERVTRVPLSLLGVALLLGFLTPGPVPLLRATLGMEDTFFAALLEEALKGLSIAVALVALKRRFPSVRPGIEAGLLLGAAVGLGFAFVENLINLNARDFADPPLVALQRGLVANPGHMIYSAAFGVGIALLAWGGDLAQRSVGGAFMLVAPVAHGLHNHLVTAAFSQGTWIDVAASAAFLTVILSLEALLLNLMGAGAQASSAPARRG